MSAKVNTGGKAATSVDRDPLGALAGPRAGGPGRKKLPGKVAGKFPESRDALGALASVQGAAQERQRAAGQHGKEGGRGQKKNPCGNVSTRVSPSRDELVLKLTALVASVQGAAQARKQAGQKAGAAKGGKTAGRGRAKAADSLGGKVATKAMPKSRDPLGALAGVKGKTAGGGRTKQQLAGKVSGKQRERPKTLASKNARVSRTDEPRCQGEGSRASLGAKKSTKRSGEETLPPDLGEGFTRATPRKRARRRRAAVLVARRRRHGRQAIGLPQKKCKPIRAPQTDDTLAALAGMSRETYRKALIVLRDAPAALQAAAIVGPPRPRRHDRSPPNLGASDPGTSGARSQTLPPSLGEVLPGAPRKPSRSKRAAIGNPPRNRLVETLPPSDPGTSGARRQTLPPNLAEVLPGAPGKLSRSRRRRSEVCHGSGGTIACAQIWYQAIRRPRRGAKLATDRLRQLPPPAEREGV